MHYTFIEKAQQEADLQDVVNYLQEPLKTIEELFYKFPKLSITSKVDHTNQDLYQECERILNYHLPNLINNYCSFSMKYRNEHIIKTESKNGQTEKYTAKTLLLNDLAKIIEEVNIIETKFNDINKMDFLVTNRMISNLGQQSALIAPEYETEKVALKNQFNYSIYSTDQIPKDNTTPVSEPYNIIAPHSNNTTVSVPTSDFATFFFKPKTQMLLGLGTGLIISIFGGISLFKALPNKNTPAPVVVEAPVQYQEPYRNNRDDNYIYVRPTIPNDPVAVLAYNYNINLELDKIKQIIHDKTINFLKDNITRGYFNIVENTINKNNDSYKITLTNVPEAKCSDIASHTYNHYDVINVNNKNLSGLNIENSALNSITSHMCELQHNTIELIQTK